MKHIKSRLAVISLTLFLFVLLVSCGSKKKYEYYAIPDNYISVTGTVSYTKLSEDMSTLFIEFDDMSIQLSDNCFKVVGNNLCILQENMNGKEIHIGDQLEFVTAPKYFGDGYVMPIVSIKQGETVYLEFQEGVENLLSWLGSQ